MSLNISEALLKHATAVNVGIDLRTLGSRQRATLNRYLRDGVITSGGVPGEVAYNLLKQSALPAVIQSRACVKWYNLPETQWQALMDLVVAAHVAHRLTPKRPNGDWFDNRLKDLRAAPYCHKGRTYWPGGSKIFTPDNAKGFMPPRELEPVPDIVTINLLHTRS